MSLASDITIPCNPRSAHVPIGLRYPCFAQARGGRHWPPVQRMRSTPVLHAPSNDHALQTPGKMSGVHEPS